MRRGRNKCLVGGRVKTRHGLHLVFAAAAVLQHERVGKDAVSWLRRRGNELHGALHGMTAAAAVRNDGWGGHGPGQVSPAPLDL